MVTSISLPEFIRLNYEIVDWKHASAILHGDFPSEWNDIISILIDFRLKKDLILNPDSRKSPISSWINNEFYKRGWVEKCFEIKIVIDQIGHETPTHRVKCYKNRIGVEFEWNNIDTFYDRDLNNFRVLYKLRALSVGVMITRSDELHEIFTALNKGSSYGASTTHMSKLVPRIEGGGSGGCPVVVFGIKKDLFVDN